MPASTNAPASVPRLSRLTGSAAQSLARASWPPRSRAAGSRPASSQARAASLIRRRTRRPSRLASIQVRSRGQAVSRASWVICAVSASTVISRSATKRPSTSPGGAASPGQSRSSASGTDAARLGRVVGHVDQPQEQPPGDVPLVLVERLVDLVGRPRDRVPDAPAGLVVGHGEPAAMAAVPGGEQGMGQQRQGPGLVGGPGRAAVRGVRREVAEQQLDQAVLHGRAGPGGLARRWRCAPRAGSSAPRRPGAPGVPGPAPGTAARGRRSPPAGRATTTAGPVSAQIAVMKRCCSASSAARREYFLELIDHDQQPADHCRPG